MNQYLKDTETPQVLYQGRWVDRKTFRAFVYNETEQKLANSYDEYSDLIESGLWFCSQEDIQPKEVVNIRQGRKAKNGSNS